MSYTALRSLYTSKFNHLDLLGSIIIIIIIIINWSPQYKADREWEDSISPKAPTPHNQPMEGRKR